MAKESKGRDCVPFPFKTLRNMKGMLGFCNVLLSVSVLLTNEYKHVSLCLTFDLSVKPEFAAQADPISPHS